jgi:hypothetical protein
MNRCWRKCRRVGFHRIIVSIRAGRELYRTNRKVYRSNGTREELSAFAALFETLICPYFGSLCEKPFKGKGRVQSCFRSRFWGLAGRLRCIGQFCVYSRVQWCIDSQKDASYRRLTHSKTAESITSSSMSLPESVLVMAPRCNPE